MDFEYISNVFTLETQTKYYNGMTFSSFSAVLELQLYILMKFIFPVDFTFLPQDKKLSIMLQLKLQKHVKSRFTLPILILQLQLLPT